MVKSALAGACAALLLTGCSVTVQPKHAAPVAAASTSAPATPAATSADPAPTPTPTDVDHPACLAVHEAMQTAQQKVTGPDKNSRRRTGNDYKDVATALRAQAQKTKDADLKSTLTQFAADYDQIASDVQNGRNTDADQKKIEDLGPHLDQLCPQKS